MTANNNYPHPASNPHHGRTRRPQFTRLRAVPGCGITDSPDPTPTISPTTPAGCASVWDHTQRTALERIRGMLIHPRSLARQTPSWRPPAALLGGGAHHRVRVEVIRHRVGPLARARLRGYGEKRTPAFLITLRFTEESGAAVPAAVAEPWVAKVLEEYSGFAVHELLGEPTATFCWLADANLTPLYSPASMFGNTRAA